MLYSAKFETRNELTHHGRVILEARNRVILPKISMKSKLAFAFRRNAGLGHLIALSGTCKSISYIQSMGHETLNNQVR